MEEKIGFRHRENLVTIDLIRKYTDIPDSVIGRAMESMLPNDYHNVDHMFFAVRAVIEIGRAEERSRQELNLLVLIMLFHDAGHDGVAKSTDEMDAFKIALSAIPQKVLELCRENELQNLENMLRDGIMATCFSMRGKISDPFLHIIQDADIFCVATDSIFWMYLCSGIGLEFSRQFNKPEFADPLIFFKGGDNGGQREFVSTLESITGSSNILLSEGAKDLCLGNARRLLAEIEAWSDRKILHAFNLRKKNLTIQQYCDEISKD